MVSRANQEPDWDSAAAERYWQRTAKRARKGFYKIFDKSPDSRGQFYHLCLAEMDAAKHLAQTKCFASQELFLAELNQLLSRPTPPSGPVASLEGYNACQKSWIEFLIHQTLNDPEVLRLKSWPHRLAESLLIISSLLFLIVGCFLMLAALDADRARKFNLFPWQAFVGFLLCFLLFGLIAKWLDEPGEKRQFFKRSKNH
jgi:hypothetical protein